MERPKNWEKTKKMPKFYDSRQKEEEERRGRHHATIITIACGSGKKVETDQKVIL